MKKIISLTILSFFILQTAVYAEWVYGIVRKVDVKNSILTIQQIEEEKEDNFPNQIKLKVVRDAIFRNIPTLDELEVGNEVKVNVRENQNLGIWEATEVEFKNEVKGEER
ncbi:MAG: hypothetical protein NUV91_05345 [Candidatus Omnitrophica bacterium]|nr:hypothetical protein [Candidatus Omnitrophota bacterium]